MLVGTVSVHEHQVLRAASIRPVGVGNGRPVRRQGGCRREEVEGQLFRITVLDVRAVDIRLSEAAAFGPEIYPRAIWRKVVRARRVPIVEVAADPADGGTVRAHDSQDSVHAVWVAERKQPPIW